MNKNNSVVRDFYEEIITLVVLSINTHVYIHAIVLVQGKYIVCHKGFHLSDIQIFSRHLARPLMLFRVKHKVKYCLITVFPQDHLHCLELIITFYVCVLQCTLPPHTSMWRATRRRCRRPPR